MRCIWCRRGSRAGGKHALKHKKTGRLGRFRGGQWAIQDPKRALQAGNPQELVGISGTQRCRIRCSDFDGFTTQGSRFEEGATYRALGSV